jgi:hypothetical protein
MELAEWADGVVDGGRAVRLRECQLIAECAMYEAPGPETTSLIVWLAGPRDFYLFAARCRVEQIGEVDFRVLGAHLHEFRALEGISAVNGIEAPQAHISESRCGGTRQGLSRWENSQRRNYSRHLDRGPSASAGVWETQGPLRMCRHRKPVRATGGEDCLDENGRTQIVDDGLNFSVCRTGVAPGAERKREKQQKTCSLSVRSSLLIRPTKLTSPGLIVAPGGTL